MPHDVSGDRGSVAAGNSVSPDPAFLEMVGGHLKNVPLPLSSREALPSVRRIGWWVRAAVHVDCLFGRLPRDVGVVGDELLGLLIYFLPDPEQGRSTPGIVGG